MFRTAFAVSILAAAVVLTGCGAPANNASAAQSSSPEQTKKKKKDSGKVGKWVGKASHEASGVAPVPGTDQVLFVDDNNPNAVYAMSVDDEGNQVGDLTEVKLGVEVDDPEDITFDGTNYYVVGSQSHPKTDKDAGLVRFTYDASQKTASNVASIDGLRTLLLAKVPQIAKSGAANGNSDGLNIEGLGWDPASKRLLLGLRSPLDGDNAVVVPIDPGAAFSASSATVGEPVTVPLEGNGIRSIEHDDVSGKFLIISGAMGGEKKGEFALWTWDLKDAPKKITVLDQDLKPEGITRVARDGGNFLFVVCDAGYYFRLDTDL